MVAEEQAAGPALALAPVIRVGSLADLEVIETEIEIRRPDGARLVVPVRSLTDDEQEALRQRVPRPSPPATLLPDPKGGRPRLVKNYEDAGFLAAQQAAGREFAYLLLLHSLRIEIPGETEAEQLAALHARLGAWASRALAEAVLGLHGVTAEDLEAARGN